MALLWRSACSARSAFLSVPQSETGRSVQTGRIRNLPPPLTSRQRRGPRILDSIAARDRARTQGTGDMATMTHWADETAPPWPAHMVWCGAVRCVVRTRQTAPTSTATQGRANLLHGRGAGRQGWPRGLAASRDTKGAAVKLTWKIFSYEMNSWPKACRTDRASLEACRGPGRWREDPSRGGGPRGTREGGVKPSR